MKYFKILIDVVFLAGVVRTNHRCWTTVTVETIETMQYISDVLIRVVG